MKQILLITGANGMLAKELAKQLEQEYTVRFLTRTKRINNEYVWDIDSNYIDPEALIGVNKIIHLAGASIATNRWTKKRKEIILSSRVDSAQLILAALKKHAITIEAFISASAIGYYGSVTKTEVFDEDSPKGNDFLSNVCYEWEQAAADFKSTGVAERVVIVRTGIVLAKNEGALQQIMKPILYGLGSGLGNGNQYMPWIHIQDMIGIYKFILDNKTIDETFNAVAPQQLTNLELTKAIAKQVNRPLFLPNIPKWFLHLLFGEMATILLNGSKISSKKIIAAGYRFQYEKIEDALKVLI